jgi:glycosyltransferase involved in cell wall biosynthesis
MTPQKPLTVLHFTITEIRGGVEEHMLLLLRGLDRRHFRPMLVCPASLAEKLRDDLPTDVPLVPLRFQSPLHGSGAFQFAKILRKYKVDILHSHMFQASRLSSPIAWACGVPLIVETPHVREHWRKGWIKQSYFVDRLVGRFVDQFIAVSGANARYLAEEKKLPPRKIHVIRNGCNFARLDPSHPAPLNLRRDLGFGENDPILLVLGRLEPQKGHRILLEALQGVREEFPTVQLICAGEGRLRGELEDYARVLGISDCVRFVGYQTNVADWLALADITVLPSFFEGLPLFAIESLASEKPMVATAVDGTTEVVVNEKTGLTVSPGKAVEMAAAIRRLLQQPEWAKSLGRAGRKWVLGEFSEERQVQMTSEFYLRLWTQRQDSTSPGTTRARDGRETQGTGAAVEPSEWVSKPE